jgi:hypothetical protein
MIRTDKGQAIFWASTVLAVLSVILVVSDGVLFLGNHDARELVNRRQQFINQSIQLARFNEVLVRSLAASAAANDDTQLRQLLDQLGLGEGAKR